MQGEFLGTIGRTITESVPWWPPVPHAPAGAPNIVMIVLDDVGYSQLGCYGSSIRTPNIDRLAAEGVRYTNFHATPLCSPTRACVLTGRNNHSVGMRGVANFAEGFPNARCAITPAAATLPEVLHEHGYMSFCVGKWHLTPPDELTAGGPYDNWPLQKGFDRFYGFLGGGENHWAPQLWYDNHQVDPPSRADYHLSDDLADRSVEFVRDHVSVTPERPFFLYLAFGAGHAPHHAPTEWIERYRGQFDAGWDVERELAWSRQQASGVIPPNTRLSPRDRNVPDWEDLDDRQRQLCARYMEVYAGFVSHADAAIGRVVASLDELGVLDDSIVVVLSDNGASFEGRAFGAANYRRHMHRVRESFDEAFSQLDELGGPTTYPVYPAGWAMAGNSPLRWYKGFTHGGGVRVPVIMRWPTRIPADNSTRRQFHHVIDLYPTLLDAVGVAAPTVHRGIEQMPVHGVSLTYTWGAPTAESRRLTQYFENHGHRGIYHEGWKAVVRHNPKLDYDDETWELYHLDRDFSESENVAAEHPEIVEDLVRRWWAEAEAFGVLPLDDRFLRGGVPDLPPNSLAKRRRHVLYPGAATLPYTSAPDIHDRDFLITAYLHRPRGDEDGVIVACGGRDVGWSLFVLDGHLMFDYSTGAGHSIVRSTRSLPLGEMAVSVGFQRTGERQGVASLCLRDEQIGEGPLAVLGLQFGGEGLQVGADKLTPVSSLYESPFAFAGRIDRVEVELGEKERDGAGELRAVFAEQ